MIIFLELTSTKSGQAVLSSKEYLTKMVRYNMVVTVPQRPVSIGGGVGTPYVSSCCSRTIQYTALLLRGATNNGGVCHFHTFD
mmetsp:Transcript_8120/g.12441  ORF Transcript_8120/g.12441 Transcript_8120/m.12441 type:complete len:83 (-) Transcript_8120:798-1046(-)